MKFIKKIFYYEKTALKHNVFHLFGLRIKLRNNCYIQHSEPVFTKNDKFLLKISLLNNYNNPIFHYSSFGLVNAGDNILVPALQKSINSTVLNRFNFINECIHNVIDDNDIYLINNSNGLIIGGGGLFLKDTNPNNVSGWQFPISKEQIEKIDAPIYVLGVGYNRFRNQDDFIDLFKDNINALVQKASFIGLRNSGSIRALKKYLNKNLHYKLSFHPCSTTVLSKMYEIPKETNNNFIALECAFDRANLRYGNRKDEILTSVAKVAKELSKKYEIRYYSHMTSDLEMLPFLDKVGVEYSVVNLDGALSVNQFLKLYSEPKLVIGMRGHAQMIPFGCTTPILSVITHDKLAWFLEDINHPEWGVDVLDDNFEKKLLNSAFYILDNSDLIKLQIESEKEKLYEITKQNYNRCFESM